MPDSPLRLLVVEDQPMDYELLCLELAQAGLVVDSLRVDSREGMRSALESDEWDAIISDFTLPGFSGLAALKMHRQTGRDIPFLFLSGSVGEQTAIECMKAGAQDFVTKGSSRLLPALRRELNEARARRENRTVQERYRRIVDEADDGLWCADPDGVLTFHNARLNEILGLPVEAELVGRGLLELLGAQTAELTGWLTPPYREALALPLELKRAQGDPAEILLTLRPLRQGDVLGKFTDVTQVRGLERRLQHSQKMEAVGRLAAGVAHDFNNTLTVIQGFAGMLAEELREPEQRECVSMILDAAHKGSALSKQILAVGRQQEVRLQSICLKEQLGKMEPLLRKAAGSEVTLRLRPDAERDQVQFDPDLLLQVLLNLTINARDALPATIHQPRIVVSTQEVVLNERDAPTVHALMSPGDYVMLAVSDNGTGMDEQTRSRIFEPFFTTKEKDKGTGLGLSSVYGTVTQCGGHIWVYSELGRGTTFKIYLPLVGCQALAEPDEVERPEGDFLVLVVDDCRLSRSVLCEALANDEYQVVEAESGPEALDWWEGADPAPDLVISDVVMPGMPGPELVGHLLLRKPDLPVIFTSGYGAEFCSLPSPARMPHMFIEKPINSGHLLRQVRLSLARPPK